MTMKRHLLIGAVSLVRGNVRDDGKAMVSVCDELEPLFVDQNALAGAPFDVVSLIIRYGTGRTAPLIGRINKHHSELEVAVELPMQEVKKLTYDELRRELRKATLDCLVAIAGKYGLNAEPWKACRVE